MGNDGVACELRAILHTPVRGESKKSSHGGAEITEGTEKEKKRQRFL